MTELKRRAFLHQSILAASSMLGAQAYAATEQSPVATTRHGCIRGYRDDGINVFKGVRYGADTAPRRFMALVAPQAWHGVVDALWLGPSSPQSSREAAASEDGATPKDGGRFGAPHASDIQLVFDNIAKPGATAIGPQAQTMAGMMSEAFIAFARNGAPAAAQLPPWEPYDLRRRQTMIFDVPARMEDDPRGAERRLFAKVPYVQPET